MNRFLWALWGLLLALAVAAAAVVFLLWARSAILVVGTGETGLVRTLGKVTSSDLAPGLHVVPPFPFGRAEAVSTGLLRSVEVGFRYRAAGLATAPLTSRVFVPAQSSRVPEESQFLTGDENVIEVVAVVHYRVSDPALFRFGVDRAEPAFRDLARAFLVEEVGRTPIDAIYTVERGTVERKVLEGLRLSPALKETGLAPVDLRLLFVHAPDDVHGAFRDIASAAEDRTTARNKAYVEAEGELGRGFRLPAAGVVVFAQRGLWGSLVRKKAIDLFPVRRRLCLETVCFTEESPRQSGEEPGKFPTAEAPTAT